MSASDKQVAKWESLAKKHVDQMILLRAELHMRANEKKVGFEPGNRDGCDYLSSLRTVVEEIMTECVDLHNELLKQKDW